MGEKWVDGWVVQLKKSSVVTVVCGMLIFFIKWTVGLVHVGVYI